MNCRNLALLLSCLFAFAGCYTGGTTGTGVQYSGYNAGRSAVPFPSAAVRYLTVAGRISQADGRPLGGAQLGAATQRTHEQSSSTPDGYYSIFLVRSADEPVDLRLTVNGRSYQAQWNPAATGDYVNLNIVVDAGQMRLEQR